MIFTRILLSAVAAVASFSTASAYYIGRATVESLGIAPCPIQCASDYSVALPVNLFPNGEQCCNTVKVTYQDTSVSVTFNSLYLAGADSYNISLSHLAFAQLAPLEEEEIYPVEWAFV